MEWFLAIGIGSAITVTAFSLVDTSSGEHIALMVLAPGVLLQKLAGLGGHDEGGFFLLIFGNFGFYICLCIVVLALFEAAKGHLKRKL